jgi:lipoyl(octanoyl) transferase
MYTSDFGTENETTSEANLKTWRRECSAGYLGLVEYQSGLKLQEILHQRRRENSNPDVLLLLEHEPVYTIGRFGSEEDIIVPRSTLFAEKISVINTSRGGKITFHGPGQLVGYPILNLRQLGIGVRDYVSLLEDVVIRLLGDFGIRGEKVDLHPGVWVGGRKVCSIGINVSQDVTTHGFALNVNTNLDYFEYIKPCGLSGKDITSMAVVLGHYVSFNDVVEGVIEQFAHVFDMGYSRGDDTWKTIQDYLNGLRRNT